MENTMYDVVKSRIQSKLVAGAETAKAAVQRMLDEGKIAQDFLVPIGVELKNKGEAPVIHFSANGAVKMRVPTDNGADLFSLHPHAITQLGEKMGVPIAYLRKLATSGDQWQRDLAAFILNEHTGYTQKTRSLVRTVGHEVRGVLSDQYARRNSVDIISTFLTVTGMQGAMLAGGLMDDTRLYVEVLMPEPFMIETPKNGIIGIAFGSRLQNSDYGDGALNLRTFFMQGVCLNGAVRESLMREVHFGTRIPDDLQLSMETQKKQTEASVAVLTDVSKQVFDRKRIEKHIAEIKAAADYDLDLQKELNKLQKDGKLLKTEVEGVEKLLMASRTDDGIQGEATLWKLMQGVSALARDAEPRRERELQELVGSMMEPVLIKG